VSKAKNPKDILTRMKAVTTREHKSEKPPPRGATTPSEPLTEDPVQPAPGRKVRITVDLDPETHRFLKVYAAQKGVKMSDVIRDLIATLKD